MMKEKKSIGEKIFTYFLIAVIVTILLFLTLYIFQRLCLHECCKDAGGRGMENNICVDVNGFAVNQDTSCTSKCKFWRW